MESGAQGQDARRRGGPRRGHQRREPAGQPETGDRLPTRCSYIPANVEAQIRATTAFGAKYVDLIYPPDPSPKRLSAGAVLRSRNVSTEVNTVFENLVGVLKQIDVGQTERDVDRARRRRARAGRADRRGHHRRQPGAAGGQPADGHRRGRTGGRSRDSPTPTARPRRTSWPPWTPPAPPAPPITSHASDLDALLLNTIGFARAGIDLLVPNKDNLVRAVNMPATRRRTC